MKKTRIAALAATALVGTTLPAAAVDLVPYMALTPGNWCILQDTASGQLSGYVTSVNAAGQTAQTWYRFNGSGWVFDSAELFTLTARRFSYVGTHDGSATWLFEPAVTLPRKLAVNDAVAFEGLARNQTTGEAVPFSGTLTVTAEGLAATAPAGAFTSCVKLRLYNLQGGQSRDSVSLSCPNRNEVKTWVTKIRDTSDPQVQGFEQSSSVMTQGGDASAPIP